MATYLDDLTTYDSLIQPVFAQEAKQMRLLLEASKDATEQIENINWYQQLIIGANDTTQTDALRLELLTLLVDNARLNEVPLVNVFGLYQTLGDSTITASAWGLISGNINDQLDLIAKFNTYLPLTAGSTKPLTGALYFGADDLGIDVLNETDTLNIGASAGVIQFGLDAEVKLNTITEGAWLATNIGVTKGGLGALDFASGTNGQAIIKSGAGYAFYTIPAIPSLTGYIKADGSVPMTDDLLFAVSTGIDTTAAGTLYIGQNNATAVQIFQDLSLTNVVAGNWQANPVDLEFGGTGASLAPPVAASFFIYDSGTSSFATIGDNLTLNGASVELAQVVTGSNRWRADVIEVAYGGTGLNAVGAEGDVLTVVGGVPAWTTFTALTNPMDDAGQMIYGGVAGVPTKLDPNATSTNRFLRSVSSGNPSWEILVAGDIPTIAQSQVSGLVTALTNKLSTVLTDGYMYIGNAANAAVGVEMYGDATIDNSGSLLIADEAVTFAKMQNITATTLVGRWSAGDGPMQEVTIGSGLSLSLTGVLTSGGLVNPMTTIGDMIIGDTGGDPIRLAAGTNGYILTMVSGSPAWAVAASGGGNVTGPGPTVVDGNFAVYNGTGGLTIGQSGIASLDTGGNASFASLKITATGGNGHIHMRHQASAVAGLGSSNTIYALPTASNGFGFVIDNAAYASSLIFGATLARTYTLPDLSGTFALTNAVNAWGSGIKQTFAPSASTAGVNVGSVSGDVSTPANGDLWYDSTGNLLRARINGATVSLGAGGGGSGTVTNTGTLTANRVILGNGGVDVTTVAGIATNGTSQLQLGVAGTSVGSVQFANATSGTITLQPVTGALGTVTISMPATTTTLAGLAVASQDFTQNQIISFAPTAISGTNLAALDLTGTGGTSNAASLRFSAGTIRWMDFGTAAGNPAGAPTFTTRSAGTKIVFASGLGAAGVDYSIGVSANAFWFAVTNATSHNYIWYGGTTVAMTLGSNGNLTLVGDLTIPNAKNIILGTGTGTKIGTGTTQKLSFWNKTPVVQPTNAITASAFVANTSGIANDTATYGTYTIGQIAAALIQVGILA